MALIVRFAWFKNIPLQLVCLIFLAPQWLLADSLDVATQRYIVVYSHEAGRDSISKNHSVIMSLPQQSALVLALNQNEVAIMQQETYVSAIMPDPKRFPLTAGESKDSSKTRDVLQIIQTRHVDAHNAGQKKVCIVDSGIDWLHPSLSNNWVEGGAEGTWQYDYSSHGTRVAGVVAATKSQLSKVEGVIHHGQAAIYVVNVFKENSWAYASDIIAAIDECEQNDANLINLSLGGMSPNPLEEQVLDHAYNKGILSVAAAGNQSSDVYFYPASYQSVISVGAIDSSFGLASFSQTNDQVELVAPGVNIYSTSVVDSQTEVTLTFGEFTVDGKLIDGTPVEREVTAELVNCGLAETDCLKVEGKICLIQRGKVLFSEKLTHCFKGGGVGAIIYNHENQDFYGATKERIQLPAVGVSHQVGKSLLKHLGEPVSLLMSKKSYSQVDGTSVAAAFVSGAALLIWGEHVGCSAREVRDALTSSALDLGARGRDLTFGFGLVQVKPAIQKLNEKPCQ